MIVPNIMMEAILLATVGFPILLLLWGGVFVVWREILRK